MSVSPLATSQMNMPEESPARQTWTIDCSTGPRRPRSRLERRQRPRPLERRPREADAGGDHALLAHHLERELGIRLRAPPRHVVDGLVVLLAEEALPGGRALL